MKFILEEDLTLNEKISKDDEDAIRAKMAGRKWNGKNLYTDQDINDTVNEIDKMSDEDAKRDIEYWRDGKYTQKSPGQQSQSAEQTTTNQSSNEQGEQEQSNQQQANNQNNRMVPALINKQNGQSNDQDEQDGSVQDAEWNEIDRLGDNAKGIYKMWAKDNPQEFKLFRAAIKDNIGNDDYPFNKLVNNSKFINAVFGGATGPLEKPSDAIRFKPKVNSSLNVATTGTLLQEASIADKIQQWKDNNESKRHDRQYQKKGSARRKAGYLSLLSVYNSLLKYNTNTVKKYVDKVNSSPANSPNSSVLLSPNMFKKVPANKYDIVINNDMAATLLAEKDPEKSEYIRNSLNAAINGERDEYNVKRSVDELRRYKIGASVQDQSNISNRDRFKDITNKINKLPKEKQEELFDAIEKVLKR